MEKFRNLLKKLRKAYNVKDGGYWVTGSGLVCIPEGHLNEIPKVIAEYHAKEANLASLIASTRRVI